MIFEKTDNTYIQLFRYFFVAAGAFVMDYGFYFLLSYIFGVQYLIAAIAGFIAGTSTNYLISKYMVFQGEPQSRSVEVFLVFLISGIGLLWLELGLYLLTDIYGMHYLLSKLVMTAVVFLWNFFARKFFMYSKFYNILKEQ
ncbi:MAG: GtrA family protein [Bacteroidaceae bacterium]|nr:GtrA family protein [Bacteroidaceae bacterium]MBQ3151974.1 GtrA family protein [Bacteroidaceae bacterium]MBQ4038643.1 GtrA family protein [Bacteroidaceae bacterium]